MTGRGSLVPIITVACITVGVFTERGTARGDGARPVPTRPIVHTVTLGGNLTAIAADGRTGRVFVIDRGLDLGRVYSRSGRMFTLDARVGTLLSTVAVGLAPLAVAVDEGTGRVFVVNGGAADAHAAGSVSTLDAANGTLLHTTAIGMSPTAIVIDKTTGRVLVTGVMGSGHDAAVTLLDGRSGARVCIVIVRAGVQPLGLAAVEGQAVVVTSDDHAAIIDEASGRLLHTAPLGQGAGPVALDARTRRAFVVNQDSNTVGVLDLDTGSVHTVSVGVAPSAVAVDATTGRAFVVNTGDNTVSVLDAREGAVLRSVVAFPGPSPSLPQLIALDAHAGRVVVASPVAVSVLDARDGAILRTIPLTFNVTALSVDGATGHAFATIGLGPTYGLVSVLALQGGARPAAAPTAPPSEMRLRAVLRAFFDAYNNHDVAGVLALLGHGFQYGDCDDARRIVYDFHSKAEVATWLRARFADHDRFTQVDLGSPDHALTSPPVVNPGYIRTNDTLRAQGRVHVAGAKVILTPAGDRISTMALTSAELCAASS